MRIREGSGKKERTKEKMKMGKREGGQRKGAYPITNAHLMSSITGSQRALKFTYNIPNK